MATNRAIILAAGSSERLGMHKALVEVGGMTLIELVGEKLQQANLKVTIVTRRSLEESIRTLLPEAEIVVNPNPEMGRTGTVQCGIHAVGVGPVLIVPVDRPGFSDSTLTSLLAASTTTCPASGGRGGHPLLLSEEDASRILEVAPSVPLRDLIEPVRIEVLDPHLHLNVDKTSDLVALGDAFAELR